jgi:polysaccharide biosynthesis protein PslH
MPSLFAFRDRLRILFLSAFLPSPQADSAGVLDAYHILRELCRQHEVTLLTFASAEDLAHLPHLRGLCREVIAISAKVQPGSFAAKLYTAGTVISRLPAIARMCDSPEMHGQVRRLLAARAFDLVHVEFTQMAHYIEHLNGTPSILDESDIAFVRRQRFTSTVPSWSKRKLLAFDTRKLRNYELGFCSRFDAVIVRTEPDRRLLRRDSPGPLFEIVPPWIDLSFAPHVRDEPCAEGLLFYGAMWRAVNEQAATYFVREILPFITDVRPRIRFTIAGSRPSAGLRRMESRTVHVTGYLDRIAPEYDRTAVVVVPLLAGSGIKGKIIQALACGKPVVTTTIGAEGIPGTEADGLFVRDQPRAFADCVNWLLDGVRYLGYRDPARRFVHSYYDWDAGMARLEKLYRNVIARGGQRYPSAAVNF